MPRVATVTLRQLAALRLALRLQKVKSIRLGLLKFRAGTSPEHVAIHEIFQAQEQLNGLDFGLLMLEARAMKDSGGVSSFLLPLALTDNHYELALHGAREHYGAMGGWGSQAEQAVVLQLINEEQEGLVMALKTATEINEKPLTVSQQQPRGMQ